MIRLNLTTEQAWSLIRALCVVEERWMMQTDRAFLSARKELASLLTEHGRRIERQDEEASA